MSLKKFVNSTLLFPEYMKIVNEINRWSVPKYQCPECGGGMYKDLTIVFLTHPAQYLYQCDKCGHTEHHV